MIRANVSPTKAYIIYDYTITDNIISSGDSLTLNALVDSNTDGDWEDSGEWVVQNQSVPSNLTAGTYTNITPAFDGHDSVTLTWVRLLLTRNETIPVGGEAWTGEGSFTEGEVEDFKFYVDWCPGQGCPPPPGPDNDDDDVPEDTPPPGDRVGWNWEPIKCFALVVQGVDHGKDTAAKEAGDQMERLLRTQGYEVSRLNGTNGSASDARIDAWVTDVVGKIVCQDKVLIYFIGHGRKETPGGLIRLRKKTKSDEGTYTGAELAATLAKIMPCDGERCDTPNKSCDVTVIMESCYAGQWLDILKGPGRRIITSSEGDTPSYFGEDGTGGAYSDSYTECANPAVAGTVDSSGDGNVDPGELHTWANNSIGDPYGQRQKPQVDDQTCDCVCPPTWWDCVCDLSPDDPFVPVFFPSSIFGFEGQIGQGFSEFPSGLEVPDATPIYDFVILEEDPTGWNWSVEINQSSTEDELFPITNLQVFVQNIPPGAEVNVPLFILFGDISPTSLQLIVDLNNNSFMLFDTLNPTVPILDGPWNQFEDLIANDPSLEPINAYRGNVAPGLKKSDLKIESFGQALNNGAPTGSPKWFNLQWSPASADAEYLIQFSSDPKLEIWSTIGFTNSTSFTVLYDPLFDYGFYRVRPQEAGTGLPF